MSFNNLVNSIFRHFSPGCPLSTRHKGDAIGRMVRYLRDFTGFKLTYLPLHALRKRRRTRIYKQTPPLKSTCDSFSLDLQIKISEEKERK